MQKHTKIYFKHFGIKFNESGWHDTIFCEHCDKQANDIHHINGRGKDKDVIENLIALCRKCHNMAHANELTKHDLTYLHRTKMMKS